jgi:hypothetical protein
MVASPNAGRSEELWRAATLTSFIILLGFSVAYATGGVFPVPLRVSILLAAAVAGAVLVTIAWLRTKPKIHFGVVWSAPVFLTTVMACGYLVGLLLLGNVLITRMDVILAHLWPWAGLSIADRPVSDLAASSLQLVQSPSCTEGFNWGFRTLAGHCGSFSMVVRTYGLALVVMACVVAWWSQRSSGNEDVPDRQLTMTQSGIILCLLAMPISFILYDFLSPAGAALEIDRSISIWLRSRLAEPWFYSGILLSLSLFLNQASSRGRRLAQSVMMIAIGVFALSPFEIPSQFVANFSYLFTMLLK